MDLLAAVKDRTLLLDGAMGTELIRRGFEPGGPPEEWNATRPDDVAGDPRRLLRGRVGHRRRPTPSAARA